MKVFLSYAYDDAAVAKRFRKALADSGLEVFDPDRDHLPGDNWAARSRVHWKSPMPWSSCSLRQKPARPT